MKYLYLLLPVILTLQIACHKEYFPPVSEPPIPNSGLDSNIVWAQPITPDTSERILDYLLATKEQVIYVQLKDGYEETVVAREAKTGRIKWTWGDSRVASGYMISDLKMEGDKIIVQSWQDLFVLDAGDGSTLWHTDVRLEGDCAYPRMSVIDGHIYYTTNDCAHKRAFGTLWRTPIEAFRPQQVYRLFAKDPIMGDSGWIYGIGTAALWQNPDGDSVLVFQTRAYKKGAAGNKADLLAFNLKKGGLEWKVDSVSQEGYSSVNTPIVKGNFIYHTGHFSVQKIDALTGTVLWSYKFTDIAESFSFTGITLAPNGGIYAYPGANYLYALDGNNGNRIWKAKLECCGVTGDIAFNQNKLYFVSPPHFYVLDAERGGSLDKFPSPLKKGNHKTQFSQFARVVQIPGEKTIITFDSHYLMARKF